MILVDTSVWISHFRAGEPTLVDLLDAGQVLGHPWVVGELALGRLADRVEVVRLLAGLPQAIVAADREVMALVDRHRLFGRDIAYVDAQLLAATRLTPGAKLWTADRRLVTVADELGCAFRPGDRSKR